MKFVAAPFIFLAVAVLVSLAAVAQSTTKIPVQVLHSGSDLVGQQLAFELKEAIRASQSMRLVTDTDSGARVRVSIVSLNPDPERASQSHTVAATTFAFDDTWVPLNGILVSATVETCGARRVQECARSTLANIDSVIERIRKSAPNLWKDLR